MHPFAKVASNDRCCREPLFQIPDRIVVHAGIAICFISKEGKKPAFMLRFARRSASIARGDSKGRIRGT